MPAVEGGAVPGRVDEALVLGVGDLGPVDGEGAAFDHPARALVVLAGVVAEDERAGGDLDRGLPGIRSLPAAAAP